MKLKRLYIGEYRVLRDLEINFDSSRKPSEFKPSYSLDFLVGVNGTGKSTVLWALVNIFTKLEANQPINFPFELEYEMGKPAKKIKVSNLLPVEDEDNPPPKSEYGQITYWVNNEEKNLGEDSLPKQIVVFTTGKERQWETLVTNSGDNNQWIAFSHLEKTLSKIVREEESEAIDRKFNRLKERIEEEYTIAIEKREEQKGKANQEQNGFQQDELPWSEESIPTETVKFDYEKKLADLEVERESEKEKITDTSVDRLVEEKLAFMEIPGRKANLADLDISRDRQVSKLLFIPSNQLALVTLCGFLADLGNNETGSGSRALTPLFDEAKIEHFPGFSLKFRLNSANASPRERDFVDELSQEATRTVLSGSDRLLVFDFGKGQAEDKAKKIIEKTGSGLDLFKKLSQMAQPVDYKEAILQEVNIFVERRLEGEKKPHPPLLLFDWLSDGEQSFLARLSLFTMLNKTENLILLDEPEVHFNDYWKRQIINILDKSLRETNNHVLIISHSSITLTDVPQDDIIIIKRSEGQGYTNTAENPRIATFASDPSDIIVHVFGAPNPSGENSINRIENAIETAVEDKTPLNKERLEYLLSITGAGYWSYRLRSALEELKQENNT